MPHRDSTEPILRALRRIIRKTSGHSRQLARDTGLSVPQSLCLRIIGDATRGSEVTVVRVAEAVQLAPATVSRLLDRLEEAELIVRERRSQDRRKVCLRLTPLGRRRLRKLPPLLQEEFTSRLQRLSERKQVELLRALETIVELMEAVDLDAAPVLDPKLAID
jgi:DNA-binding MarR family transcriptional regulator